MLTDQMQTRHPTTHQSMRLCRCNVLIIGAGITGLAIAERLSREAKRWGRSLQICLLEREQRLGSISSSGLEGWYHTGALYSKADNPQTFANCLNALEDLFNWYGFDDAFLYRRHCNVERRLEFKEWVPHLGVKVEEQQKWFEGTIFYLLSDEPEGDSLPLDRRRWENVRESIKQRILHTFWDLPWGDERHSSAPFIQETPFYVLASDLEVGAVKQRVEALFEAELQAFKQVTANLLQNSIQTQVLPSKDVVMQTKAVLEDLRDAAMCNGVRVVAGAELKSVIVPPVRKARRSERGDCTGSGNGCADALGGRPICVCPRAWF